MYTSSNSRRFEVQVGDEWVEASLNLIEKGDVIRIFSPNGTPVVCDITGATLWEVEENPVIKVNPLNPTKEPPVESE